MDERDANMRPEKQEQGERLMEAMELADLEAEGLKKEMAPFSEGFALMGDQGPRRARDLLTEEEYQAFHEIAEKANPTDEEIERGLALAKLMLARYPDGPASA